MKNKFAIFSVIAAALFISGARVHAHEHEHEHATAFPRDHEWLKQLVGAWDIQFKAHMPAMEAVGTDTVRAIGDHWVVAEIQTTMMGAPYIGTLSLGYDPLKKHFNGAWIDSMSGQLWIYKGTLNDAGDTLTLETEGPSIHGLDKTARYREAIQITGKDSRTFTSSIETDEGTWMKLLTIEYRRKTDPQPGAAGSEQSQAASKKPNQKQQQQQEEKTVNVHYLEIVTPLVNETCHALARTHGVTFSEPIAELGNARTAELRGGGRIGVRAPMRDTEAPVIRPYVLVDDIEAAVKAAEAAGAEVAMHPTMIPGHGTFAIYVLGGIDHGLWQL